MWVVSEGVDYYDMAINGDLADIKVCCQPEAKI